MAGDDFVRYNEYGEQDVKANMPGASKALLSFADKILNFVPFAGAAGAAVLASPTGPGAVVTGAAAFGGLKIASAAVREMIHKKFEESQNNSETDQADPTGITPP